MQRRWSGLALLAVAAAAMLVIPGVAGQPMAGIPLIAPIPGPPAQRSCLAPITTSTELDSLVDAVPVVPCSSSHGAEITLQQNFFPIAPNSPWPTSNRDPIFNEPISVCSDQNDSYVGTSGTSDFDRVLPRYRTKVTIPSEVQWLAGQRWYTCEVLPDVDLPLHYDGTVEQALHGIPPTPFATCAPAPHAPATRCDRPHSAEQLSLTLRDPTQSSPPPRSNTADQCRELAKKIIGTSDPEFDGQLEITDWLDGTGLSCWLQAANGRLLVGTLIGHGSGPLPLT